jgi:hypothetical protein
MTQEQIDALRSAAEKATPGKRVWRGKSASLHVVGSPPYSYGPTILNPTWEYDSGADIEGKESDFDFIAACDRETILSLLAERDALLRVAEAAKAWEVADRAHVMSFFQSDAPEHPNLQGAAEDARKELRAALAALTPGETSDAG